MIAALFFLALAGGFIIEIHSRYRSGRHARLMMLQAKRRKRK